jgi:protein TonB
MVTERIAGTEDTANDKFKRGFGNWFWGSLIAATFVHFVVFAFWPTLEAQGNELNDDVLEALNIPPEVEIPPPPQQIARPAVPVVAPTNIEEDITIAETTFESNPISDLPPPPANATSEDIAAAPVFTPYTVAPRLLNTPEVQRALERNYPALLRNAGIGGQVLVWFYIDDSGRVVKTLLKEPSGYPTLDEAAIKVAEIMRFEPAINRDKKVAVWVAIPIKFDTKD